jgi:zinc-binding alcohol dehydrogenase/oxidoreductase
MDAWILDDSPGTYRWGVIELPPLAADEVRVRVVTSALNHLDLWITRGLPRPKLPHVPGCDAAGVIESIGSAVTHLAVGDEVVVNPGISPVEDIVAFGNNSPLGPGFTIVGEHVWGGHATFVQAPARNIVRRPANRTWAECAAYPIAYLTAYRMLQRARLTAGETVLVVGIGSGVACAALTLAKHMGADVIVTSRSEAKRTAALGLGASAAYDSADRSWPVQADVIVESVGPATWQQSTRSLKPGGRMVVCGSTSGPNVEISMPRLFFKQWEIIGSTVGSYQEFAAVTQLIESGLPVIIDHVFAVGDYPAALQRMDAAEQLGNIVIQHPIPPGQADAMA